MNTIDIGATKYTFGLRVGTVTLDPVVIWGQFQRNITYGIGQAEIGISFIIS